VVLAELLWACRVLGVRQLASLWRTRRTYLELVPGHYAARTIAALTAVGFFDELRSKQVVDAEHFAASQGLDAKMLRALADYLGALQVLAVTDGGYSLRRKGDALAAMPGAFDLTGAYEDTLHHLEALLRRQLVYGADVRRNQRLVARASGAGGSLFSHPLVIDVIKRRGFERVLDLACGDGVFLVSLCRALDAVMCYGIDLAPEAIDDAQRRVREANFDGRIQLFTGDVLHADTIAQRLPAVDVITSLYGFEQLLTPGSERILQLLATWRQLAPQATFVICELMWRDVESLQKRRGGIAELQLVQALAGQRFATHREWMDIWRQAGFRRIEQHRLDFAHTVIYVLDW
jgi:trans-aconitate methyltransferase